MEILAAVADSAAGGGAAVTLSDHRTATNLSHGKALS